MNTIQVTCESVQFILTILPDAEDVVDVVITSPQLEVVCVDMFYFEVVHEDVGLGGCYPGTHGCSHNLKVILPIKLEVFE